MHLLKNLKTTTVSYHISSLPSTQFAMEHLSTFKERPIPIKIPYLCREKYDLHGAGGFSGYPERHGWNKTAMYETGTFGEKSKEEVASFFQTWLYFGLLSEVLWASQIKVDPDHFIEVGDYPRPVITTEYWPVYLDLWKQVERKHEAEGDQTRPVRLAVVKAILAESRRWIHRFCLDVSESEAIKSNFKPDFWPVPPDISHSLLALWATLEHESFVVLNRSTDEMRLLTRVHSEMLTKDMQENGWCPSDIAMLHRNTDFNGLYFFSTFPPPRSRSGHNGCSNVECREENVDDNTYTSVHTIEGCDCDHMTPNQDEIVRILGDGGIPFVTLNSTMDGEPAQLNVIRWEQGTPCVAISHVWSQGLGNPQFNSLPQCQLARIQYAVDNLYGNCSTIPFWLDTLCVPVQQHHIELHKVAISRMNMTYKTAGKMLVLEDGMQQCSIDGPWLERTAHMAMLRWHRRLWTFVEGYSSARHLLSIEGRFHEPSPVDRPAPNPRSTKSAPTCHAGTPGTSIYPYTISYHHPLHLPHLPSPSHRSGH